MTSQRNILTRGLILTKEPSGETDLNVTLYSPDLGKIRATAKGARKISSSFCGHLETLNLCRFQLYRNVNHLTITQCQVEENFKRIRRDFGRSMLASLLLEIFHKSTYSTEHGNELFRLMTETLLELATTSHSFLTIESFKLRLMHTLGILPDLNSCFSCRRTWNEENEIWLDMEGHLACLTCKRKHGTSQKRIDLPVIRLAGSLMQEKTGNNEKITVTIEQKKQLLHITHLFLQHYINREIVSERILKQLKKLAESNAESKKEKTAFNL
jgi:DNA repair protein RecO (recombination protein O)